MTRPNSGKPHHPPSGEQTRIIRRAPTGSFPAATDDTRTGIIRRTPTGPIPAAPCDEARTTVTPAADPATTAIPRVSRAAPSMPSGGATATASCVIAMLSGWTTAVVATNLITGWWDTDRLFCVAVGFLALVFAASTICGVVLVLQRRGAGRYLIVAGAVVALLAFGGVFIAGAEMPWAVYAMPGLPVASAVLALLPSTRRWCTAG